MSITRIKAAGWGVNEELTSLQITNVDINTTFALDNRAGQTDTLSSNVTVAAGGHISFASGSFLNTVSGVTCSFASDIALSGTTILTGVFTSSSGTVNLNGTNSIGGSTTFTTDPILATSNLTFNKNTNVSLNVVQTAVNSVTGIALSIVGQNCVGTTTIGGDVSISSGTGTSFHGVVRLKAGGTTIGLFGSAACTLSATNINFQGNANLTGMFAQISGSAYNTPVSQPWASSLALDYSASAHQVVTILTNNIILTFINAQAGAVYSLEVTQDASGGRNITFSGNWFFGALTNNCDTTANKKTVFYFQSKGSTGLYCIARNVY